MPPPSTNDLIQRQIEHSGYMRLLAALRFKNSSSQISNARMGRSTEFNQELRYLEIIAACLVTGNSGDVVASAFLRSQDGESLTIVLARNDAASTVDEVHCAEFLCTLKNSQNQQLRDLVPFLVKRANQSVQHRIDKVRDLTRRLNKKGRLGFIIEEYCRQKDIQSLQLEFPKRGQHFLKLYIVKSTKPSSLQGILNSIIEILTDGLELEKGKDTSSPFVLFANAAAALSDSKFIAALEGGILSYNTTTTVQKHGVDKNNLLSKLLRNLNKMRPYLRVPELMGFVQKFSLVHITWIPESIASPRHVGIKIDIPSVLDVALKLARQSMKNDQTVQRLTINDLEQKFRDRNPYWVDIEGSNTSTFSKKISITPRLHAEIKIVLYLAKRDTTEGLLRPVGCSKRSCLQCEMVMDLLDGGRWKTAGAHAWPYETAALVDNECDTILCNRIKRYATDGVQELLGRRPARPTHVSKNSEDYVTASGSENELEPGVVTKSLKFQGMGSRK